MRLRKGLKPCDSVRVWSSSWALCRCSHHFLHHSLFQSEAGIASLLYRVATCWMVLCSNPGGGEIFRTLPDRSCTVGVVKQPPSLASMSGTSWHVIQRSLPFYICFVPTIGVIIITGSVTLQWRPFSYFFICSLSCWPVAWIVFLQLQFSSVITL